VDPLTHGVASLALQRGFFPRASWRSVLAIIAAGVIADVDWFSGALSPAQFLRWNRTASHSLLFVLLVSLAAFFFSRAAKAADTDAWRDFSWLAATLAALLHLTLDLLQADSVMPLWPFSARRLALDLLPYLEPWVLTILLLAILLPELFRLVGDEIGARAKRPRGRNGAIIGLVFAALYIGVRALLHENAVASLGAHTIAGEMPHRAGAFPDSSSPFLWHSVVETQSALNLVTLRSTGGEVVYASGITTLHKPEPTPILDAAQNALAALSFVHVARFPKATVELETEGYSVEIQDLKDQATEEKSHTIFADVNLDKNGRVISSELQWQKSASGPK